MPIKPVPTATKRLSGNPGKRRRPHGGEEPEPTAYDDLPDPPDWLGDVGRLEWHRVGPYLITSGLLTEADLITFATYCQNLDLLVQAVRDIEVNGMMITGARGEVRNPALATFSAATNALRSLAQEFGMTPSSRARMRLPGDDGESLDDLLRDDEPEDAS
jgi:P27 family predicted phage terminase small subunit